MFLKRILPTIIILMAGLISFSCIGEVDKTFQNGWQDDFEVKVERKLEKYGFVPGAYYIFSSRHSKSENWQEIMTFRHDDPLDIPKESIQIINDKVAVVFMGWKAAVTSDAGKTWDIWNAEKDILDWKGVNYGLIEKITMAEDGNGIMILDPIPNRNEPKELYTTDFGKTWKQTK